MLTKIIYNCTPDSLGDIDQTEFSEAFENRVRSVPIYRDLQIEVTFNDAVKSGISTFASDDWEADISHESQFSDDFDAIAEKAFGFVTAN